MVGVPLGLKLGKDLALGVVANVADVDVTADIELFGAEHRHDGGLCGRDWLEASRGDDCSMAS